MIRIEGIPIVAARLAALESTKLTATARQTGPAWLRLLPTFSRAAAPRQPQKGARKAA